MSEEMKMSEHFPEAFQVKHNKSFEVQDATWYSYGSKYESSCDQDSAIEHAVLNHDRLTEENAELREALTRIKAWDELSFEKRLDIGSNGQRDYYRNIATEALNK